jgi:hypothetical protein
MKNIVSGWNYLGICLGLGLMSCWLPEARATPYASCISNNAGNISFYLNESGGNVTVTYENGSTNASFNGQSTGTNLVAGVYTFSLGAHTSYTISVFKVGTGVPSQIPCPIQDTNVSAGGGLGGLFITGNLRGIDVNKNPTSPYFGRIYFDRSNPGFLYMLNADGSVIGTNTGGISFVAGNASSPYRLGIAADDYIMLGDYSGTGSAVYRLPPDLTTNQLFLGPVGDSAGQTAGVHGLEFSRPLLVGNLATGASLFIIDNDFPGAQPNSILVYNNITLGALPWETAPNTVGPQIGLNIAGLNNVYPGLTRGPNGFFYASEQRANWTQPDMFVLDTTGTNELWNSLASSTLDYFVTDAGGGIAGLVDSAVSPDGNYLVGLAIDNHFTIAALTNGIPDISAISVITPPSFAGNARGICWDIADNMYSTSSGTAWVQAWTLGLTAKAVTTGNASGTTGFQLVFPSTSVSISTTNSLISQANPYGNPTSSSFTITRTNDTSDSLTVNFRVKGTAATNTYILGATNTVTFAPGQTSTNVSITAVSDGIARPVTTVTLALAQEPAYRVAGLGSATVTMLNTAPDELVASVQIPSMYNGLSNDYATLTITRWGDTNAPAFTASSFTFAGTAVEGMDYTMPTPVTFNPGDLSQLSYVYPLIGGAVPTHSASLPYTGNKTAIIGMTAGTGYTAATNKASVTIIDSATPPATVLFSDPLTSASDATHWNITAANGNMPSVSPDYTVNFGYDLQNGALFQPIPLPPSGAATALRVTCNKTGAGGAPSTGVNLYLTNVTFKGDYAVRFNMNIIQGNNYSGSTEGPLIGINHDGTETNWWTGSGLAATATVTNWPSDGIWYWVSADGDAGLGDYVEFTGAGGALPNTGWQLLAEVYQQSFTNQFKTNVYTQQGPSGLGGLPANASVENGANVNSWADVELKQIHDVVTLSIDKTTISSSANTNHFKSGMIMLGYNDPFDGAGGEDGAVYFSNLRVVQLGPPVITQIAKQGNTVVINFTSVDGEATASSFALQSAAQVKGAFAVDATATVTQLGTEAFQAVVPANGPMRYYRIVQNN